MRTSLMPRETNAHGTIHGGVILLYIDNAGAIEAKRFCQGMVVTVAMKEVVFRQPVFVGDLVSFYTRIVSVGRTSITTEVKVLAVRADASRSQIPVTDATVTYVAVDQKRRAQPIVRREFGCDPPALSKELAEQYSDYHTFAESPQREA